jgi:hypothetical protein
VVNTTNKDDPHLGGSRFNLSKMFVSKCLQSEDEKSYAEARKRMDLTAQTETTPLLDRIPAICESAYPAGTKVRLRRPIVCFRAPCRCSQFEQKLHFDTISTTDSKSSVWSRGFPASMPSMARCSLQFLETARCIISNFTINSGTDISELEMIDSDS